VYIRYNYAVSAAAAAAAVRYTVAKTSINHNYRTTVRNVFKALQKNNFF